MSFIGILNFNDTNVLEMIRKIETANLGGELYEIVKKLPISKFINELSGDRAETLKQYYGVEKILKFNQTHEYLFVNKITDLDILQDETH
jgi:hypothetical protein